MHDSLVERVRRHLAKRPWAGGSDHVQLSTSGAHVLVAAERLVARLTALGPGAVGLSFREPNGRWQPIVLIDTLEEIVDDLATAMAPPVEYYDFAAE